MPFDKRLEGLSDKARNGVPVSFPEALEVIAYQDRLRRERDRLRRERAKGSWRRLTSLAGKLARMTPDG